MSTVDEYRKYRLYCGGSRRGGSPACAAASDGTAPCSPLVYQHRSYSARKKGRLLQPGGIERALSFARQRLGGGGAVLVLLDADKDCPAQLGPALLHRCHDAQRDLTVSIVIANVEFETWLLYAAHSLRGVRGLPTDFNAPNDLEERRGAKEWLDRYMPRGYSETIDQAALAAQFDLDQARLSPSFAKLWRDFERLLQIAL